MADADHLTPLLQQYLNIKKGYKDAILFFRMGDFYEMFYEDAVVASKILEIALTTRDKRLNDPVPMCGIPYHAVNSYIPKLIREGYKVAICEQVEDPALAKGIVRREVIRIITPGTVLDGNLLDSKENNFIISLYPDKQSTGFAFVDVSTGDFYMGELKGEIAGNPQYQADDLIARIAPKEILFPADISNKLISKDSGYQKFYINLYPAEMFEYENAFRILHEQIKEDSSHLSEIDTNGPSVNAAGALLAYITDTQKTSLQNITNVKVYRNELYMAVNETAQRTLELVKPSQSGRKKGTLFHLLDRTATAMGGRLLKLWILHPLLNISDINIRQEAVEELKEAYTQRCKLRELLGSIQDMERIISRITLKVANARDFIALNQCLKVIPEIKSLISNCSAPLIRDVIGMSDDFKDLGNLISRAIIESPPLAITEGGIIKDGYSKDLDDLRQISREGKGFIARLEAKERQRSGIDSLKVRYNRVFGYYIEVTKANLRNVPSDYIRKQTLVNAERFITPELKDYESKVLGAEERIKGLEYKLFEEIREVAAHEVDKIQKSAKATALIDVISTLAEIAHLNHYVRPVVDNSHSINIREGRHPVIEQMDLGERFVPNDIDMDCERNQLMILTGPNMAGKSTYMRQAALIVLMAQIGSFVPAREASIGVVDRIFTRIGASDNIAEGRSTFMVEMEETAYILQNSTSRSLILLDEIGRGTSTFDGISIAWSCAEYINRHIKAKTLFATHYHELTELALTNEGIFNAHMVVREWNDEVIFLRKVMPGMADKSYGIQVARLAGLPPEVIIRSKEVLANLEEEELDANGMPKLAHTAKKDMRITSQIDLFSHVNDSHPILDEIRGLDLMNITPLQALAKLDELKRKISS